MGNFEDTKPKAAKEDLAYALEQLTDARFAFASFVGSFERFLIKSHFLDKDGKEIKDGTTP